MDSVTTRSSVGPLWFAGIATGVYATALAVVGQLSHLKAHANVVAVALTLDLIAVVPLAFYLLVVRRRGRPSVDGDGGLSSSGALTTGTSAPYASYSRMANH